MGSIHWGLPLLEGLLPAQIVARIATDGAADPSLNYDEPPNNGAYIFDGVSGDVLKDLTVSGRIVRVSRQKLRALCSEGINVHWGHALLSVECDDHSNSVTATFLGWPTVPRDRARGLRRPSISCKKPSIQARPLCCCG